MLRIQLLLASPALLLFCGITQAADIAVGTATAKPGQKSTGFIQVPAGVDSAANIPVIVINGAQPGPVLALVAGSHGTEYASIVALQKLAQSADASRISGTLIVVPLLNLASFTLKVPHLNPVDGKNMNRFYPGKPDGTQTERISWAISKQVVEKSDYLIDLHGGDLDENLRRYSYWANTGRDSLDATSRAMVLAFGLDHIIIQDYRPPSANVSPATGATSLTRFALQIGKPCVTAEAGHAGTTNSEDVDALMQGCWNVMRHLKMLPGNAAPVERPLWIGRLSVVVSEQDGVFFPLVGPEAYVKQGMKIGYVTDYFGGTIWEATAPVSGVVVYIGAVPSMKKGGTIASIGELAEPPDASPLAAVDYPEPKEGEWIARNFQFKTGETLPELKLHYTTIGKPEHDANGLVRNAVLIMHGTGGSGSGFLTPGFAGQLFGPGQLLDGRSHYVILPDAIGSGKSSKPSDGMHMRFPKFTYDDMVRAQYLLVTEGLGLNHLRLVMGTSMGAMHTWIWGEKYPDFMDALMPLASQPAEIAGRNRMLRKMIVDCIQKDPDWNNGEYRKPPIHGLTCAQYILSIMTSSPLQLQKQYPTRESVDAMMDKTYPQRAGRADANDMIYAYEASRSYNPEPHLDKIRAPLYAINSADDQVNPPELHIGEREIAKVKRGRFILIPTSEETRGHGTHSMPNIWGKYLAQLLAVSKL